MIETAYLITGTIILLVTMYDFFYTTLSGSGSAFITKFISRISHEFLQIGMKIIGRRIYSISGMVINLMVLITWIILVWLGLFLLFSSNPEAIVNNSGRIASANERLYYTGYTLSTLGMGDFKPVSPFFEILTSIFSFFGFVFFTTSMTYLISLSSGIINKRTIALWIHHLGSTPEEVAKNLIPKDISYYYQRISSLQEMIDRHYVNHQAYPVLHHYVNTDTASSFSLHFAMLDEAVNILIFKGQDKNFTSELLPLRNSITAFLEKMQQKYSTSSDKEIELFSKLPFDIQNEALPHENISLKQRREVLSQMLKSEGFSWNDVFSTEA